jgi:hypothetical protein
MPAGGAMPAENVIPSAVEADSPRVMAGLGPATHVLGGPGKGKSWVAGPSPAMTQAVVSRFYRSIFSAAGIMTAKGAMPAEGVMTVLADLGLQHE